MVVLWIKRPDGFGRGMLRAGVVVHRCVLVMPGVVAGRLMYRGFCRNQRMQPGRHHESQHKHSQKHPRDEVSHRLNMGARIPFRNAIFAACGNQTGERRSLLRRNRVVLRKPTG